MIANLMVFFAAIFSVLNRDVVYAGLVGLSVSYAMNVSCIKV